MSDEASIAGNFALGKISAEEYERKMERLRDGMAELGLAVEDDPVADALGALREAEANVRHERNCRVEQVGRKRVAHAVANDLSARLKAVEAERDELREDYEAARTSMRVIVCGGRYYSDRRAVAHALLRLPQDATLVHGACQGADRLAASTWESWGGRTEAHKPAWDDHGGAAGPLRNQEMVDAKADLLIAFPGGKGTADCVKRARKAQIPVQTVA